MLTIAILVVHVYVIKTPNQQSQMKTKKGCLALASYSAMMETITWAYITTLVQGQYSFPF